MKLCEIVYVVNYVKLQESNHIVATYSAYLVSIPRRLLLIITNHTAKNTRVVFTYCTHTLAQYTEVRANLSHFSKFCEFHMNSHIFFSFRSK